MASDEGIRYDLGEPPPPPPPEPDDVPVLLPAPPHPNFGWASLWCVGFLLVQLLAQTLGGAAAFVVLLIVDPSFLRALKAAAKKPSQDVVALLGPNLLGFAMFCQEVTGIFVALAALRWLVGPGWRRQIAFVPPRAIHVVLALLAMPGMMVIENLVHQAAGHLLPTFQYQESVEKFIRMFPVGLALVIFALGPALAEELMCRGFIGRGLVARHGPVVGVLLTSLLFGLMHLDPPHIVATLVMGVVLHYVYLTGRSLLLPILMHFLNNGMAVLAVKQVPPFGKVEAANWWGLAAAVLLLAAVAWALYDSRVCIRPELAEGWQPPYPGVQFPPEEAPARVGRQRPGWMSGAAVIAALVTLVLAILVA